MAKNAASKAKKSPAKKSRALSKVDVAASTASAISAANSDKTAQPGIIHEIMECLIAAKKGEKMVTTDDVLAHLVSIFPERKPEGMVVTVRAQLSRLPKEKGFKISKARDGRLMRYAAA